VHDATVEVTDETGGPLPFGREGIIRIKTPYIIHGYHNDPENTAKFLKDGWFYPGDVGRMTKHGWLILSGRHDEIINSGGVKIDPTPLDRFLLDYAGIQDAAVVGLENATGIQEIAAAVVASGDFDMRALRTELQKTFGAQRAPTLYFKVEKIPRNQAGKVMRAVMKQQLASIMAKRSEGESV
jgi:acyl-coenzyme A synthetase/AMP-(fatty) acid ligase